MNAADEMREKAAQVRWVLERAYEWAAKYPLQGEGSEADKAASVELYAYLEGAQENLYELTEAIRSLPAEGTEPVCGGCGQTAEKHYCYFHGSADKFGVAKWCCSGKDGKHDEGCRYNDPPVASPPAKPEREKGKP